MSLTPRAAEIAYPGRKPFIDTIGATFTERTLAAATVDAGNTPTSVLRRGLVLAKKAAAEDWIDAADALANENGVAEALSTIDVDGTWTGETITLMLNDSHLVTIASIVGNSAAALKGELEALPVFAANYTATVVGSAIQIDSRQKGGDVRLSAQLSTLDAFGGGAGVAVVFEGTWGEFGILVNVVSMPAIDGDAAEMNGSLVEGGGVVIETRLQGLTADIKKALQAKGMRFSATP